MCAYFEQDTQERGTSVFFGTLSRGKKECALGLMNGMFSLDGRISDRKRIKHQTNTVTIQVLKYFIQAKEELCSV